MTAITPSTPVATGTRIEMSPWAFAILALVLFGTYLMTQENGLLLNSWETVHEFFHDGRHALGFPCH